MQKLAAKVLDYYCRTIHPRTSTPCYIQSPPQNLYTLLHPESTPAPLHPATSRAHPSTSTPCYTPTATVHPSTPAATVHPSTPTATVHSAAWPCCLTSLTDIKPLAGHHLEKKQQCHCVPWHLSRASPTMPPADDREQAAELPLDKAGTGKLGWLTWKRIQQPQERCHLFLPACASFLCPHNDMAASIWDF